MCSTTVAHIVGQLVDLMKGDIGLDSSEGQGSTAWFTITFETVQAPKLTDIDDHSCGYSPRDSIANLIESPTPTVNGHSGTSSPVTPTKPREDTWILVAEDNMTNQMIALKMLKNMGFKAIAVDNGKDATVEVHKRDYSMVLMDCQVESITFPIAHKVTDFMLLNCRCPRWMVMRLLRSSVVRTMTRRAFLSLL